MEEKKHNQASLLINRLRNVWPSQATDASKSLDRTLLDNPMFVNLMKMAPSGIAIFSYQTLTYEYFSPNMYDLFGYPVDKLQGISGVDFSANTFHPDHLKIVMKLTEIVKKYYYEYALEKRITDTRFTWTVQLKKANGDYVWTLHQTMILEVNEAGFPMRSVVFISDLTDIKSNPKVDFVFSLKDPDDKGFKTVYSSHHGPVQEFVLTEREIDVLNCISKGLRNHEIADKLHISKHTVITHRRNIMKKTGKENIIQLLVD